MPGGCSVIAVTNEAEACAFEGEAGERVLVGAITLLQPRCHSRCAARRIAASQQCSSAVQHYLANFYGTPVVRLLRYILGLNFWRP